MAEPQADTSTPISKGGQSLIESAARWMADALKAWSEDDYAKVAVLAPLAVEHLGKAVLWEENPALVVPLSSDAEASLFILATQPALGNPKLRTVGLKEVLRRLEQLLGGLPLDAKRRGRMVEVRNGGMHVGTPAQSRHVLQDALAVSAVLLDRLDQDARSFYGDHQASATQLLDAKRSEVGHRVAAKLARARGHLNELEDRLGGEVFDEATATLEKRAPEALDPDDFGIDFWGVDARCPECASGGRLFGRVDVEPDVDFDVEPLGGGQYEAVPVGGWVVTLYPQVFACHVCRLVLSGPEELAECGLPSARHDIDAAALGEDFDPDLFASHEYEG